MTGLADGGSGDVPQPPGSPAGPAMTVPPTRTTAGAAGPAGGGRRAGGSTRRRRTPPAPTTDIGEVSVGELVGNVTRDLSTLMRQELALAQAELKTEARKTGKAAGALGAAGFAGYMAVLFLSICLWWALGHLIGNGWSALVVAVLWGIVGAVLLLERTQEAPRGQSHPGAHGRHAEERSRRPQGRGRRTPVTTASDPEQIRREIERTQAALSQDVDALTEKVTPGKIVERRVDRARDAATKLKEKVMGSNPCTGSSRHHGGGGVRSAASQTADRVSGTASSAASSVQDAASSAAGTVQDAASTAADAVQEAPQAIRRQTRGNPLAAGLIAFGAGWLVSSLLPASRREQELADQAKQVAQEKVPAGPAAGGRRGQGQPARAGPAGRRVGEGDRAGRQGHGRRRGPVRGAGRPGPRPGRRGHRPEQHERRLTPTCGGPAPAGAGPSLFAVSACGSGAPFLSVPLATVAA